MALITTSVIYLAPLIYLQNKEVIDRNLEQAGNVLSSQAKQAKDLTAQQTSKGFESLKQYTGDAAAKTQELVGSARQKIPLPAQFQSGTTQSSNTQSNNMQSNNNLSGSANGVRESDFPSAPRNNGLGANDFPSAPQNEFASAGQHTKPITRVPVDGEPYAASSS